MELNSAERNNSARIGGSVAFVQQFTSYREYWLLIVLLRNLGDKILDLTSSYRDEGGDDLLVVRIPNY
jgi:hypothetical protein